MRKALWSVVIYCVLCAIGLLLGSALNAIPAVSGAEVEPAMIVVLDRTAPWMKISGLDRLMPWDVIQVWFNQTGAEAYIVVLETEKSGKRSWQSLTVPGNSQTQAGCGFGFQDGVSGVEIKRLVILEIPNLIVRDEKWKK